ncbi:MAG: TlpA family protein disulfide reductase [Flammeovirgaceae bacterium]
MKKNEIVVLSILGLLLSAVFPLSDSFIGFFASIYQLIAGFIFFVVNATLGILWLQQKKRSFVTKSILPFVLSYSVCVILYTFYWVSWSDGDTFQFAYTLRSYPHQESLLLLSLYFAGLLYGYLRRNRKALKVTVGTLLVGALSFVLFYLQPFTTTSAQIDGVQFIDGNYNSIEALIRQDQFKNKTVYIDLWFSSCSPCIDQFKHHLPKLKKELAAHEISYLYLARETSHLDSKQRWIKAIAKYNLKGWHYYFPKADERIIWDEIRNNVKLEYEGYPHYLIAKNGKVISYNAPRPNDSDLVLKLLNDASKQTE